MYHYPSTYILACLCFDAIVALHFLEIALYPNTLFRFVSYTRRCAVRFVPALLNTRMRGCSFKSWSNDWPDETTDPANFSRRNPVHHARDGHSGVGV
jgi:hypothetical protein